MYEFIWICGGVAFLGTALYCADLALRIFDYFRKYPSERRRERRILDAIGARGRHAQ